MLVVGYLVHLWLYVALGIDDAHSNLRAGWPTYDGCVNCRRVGFALRDHFAYSAAAQDGFLEVALVHGTMLECQKQARWDEVVVSAFRAGLQQFDGRAVERLGFARRRDLVTG